MLRPGSRRFLRLSALAACALLAAACSGKTTGASKVSLQAGGSYSAQLNASGSCSTSCTAFMRWRQIGTIAWTNAPALNLNAPVSNLAFNQTASGLLASSLYEYQVCGAETGMAVACVGPDGTPNTTQTFNTGPGAAVVHSTWTQLSPAASPSGRLAVMAYDAASNQTVLFGGGRIGQGSFADTWTWDGTTWTQWSPLHNPPPRALQAMAYDAATGQLLMFGGLQFGTTTDLNDTWAWTGSDWSQLHPTMSPAVRSASVMAYDPATKQLILFGGLSIPPGQPGGTDLADTWLWTGTNWTQLHPATSPPGSSEGQLAYDPKLGELVYFGGDRPSGTWAWDGSNWSQLSLPVSPSNRFNNAMALDPGTGALILTGGNVFAAPVAADTWTLDAGWTKLAPATPPPGFAGAGIATDPGSGHLVLFGGVTASNTFNGTWVFGPLTLDAKALPGAATSIRYSQTLQATGATGTLSWKVSAGSLPPGLSLSQSGVISGTPTGTGTFSFTVTVTDSATSQSVSRAYSLIANQGPIPGVYVANGANSAIHGFALGLTGNVNPAPIATIAGPKTTLDGPGGLVFDQQGRLYVANTGAEAVDLFAAAASGDVAPIGILSGSNTGLGGPAGVTLDAAGNLYVADRAANAITVYAAGASGNQAPIRTISGGHTALNSPDALAIDRFGNLWATNASGGTVTEYPAGADGDVTPIDTISGLNGPQGLTQDSVGDLLVANTFGESITSYRNAPPSAVGTPFTNLSGSNTALSFPDGIDVDANGDEYVANQFGGLNVYAPVSDGNMAPIAVISGSNTGLGSPGAVAVTPPLYVTTRVLPRAAAGRRYRVQLRALLGRSPLRWRLVRGHLPQGLHLTREGAISGTPRRSMMVRFTVLVTDSTRPGMRARRTFRLVVRGGRAVR